jgi:hypothetical protein
MIVRMVSVVFPEYGLGAKPRVIAISKSPAQ